MHQSRVMKINISTLRNIIATSVLEPSVIALSIIHVPGADRMIDDLECMVGFRLYRHWWFCWKFIMPAILIVRLVCYASS